MSVLPETQSVFVSHLDAAEVSDDGVSNKPVITQRRNNEGLITGRPSPRFNKLRTAELQIDIRLPGLDQIASTNAINTFQEMLSKLARRALRKAMKEEKTDRLRGHSHVRELTATHMEDGFVKIRYRHPHRRSIRASAGLTALADLSGVFAGYLLTEGFIPGACAAIVALVICSFCSVYLGGGNDR